MIVKGEGELSTPHFAVAHTSQFKTIVVGPYFHSAKAHIVHVSITLLYSYSIASSPKRFNSRSVTYVSGKILLYLLNFFICSFPSPQPAVHPAVHQPSITPNHSTCPLFPVLSRIFLSLLVFLLSFLTLCFLFTFSIPLNFDACLTLFPRPHLNLFFSFIFFFRRSKLLL